MITSLLSWRLAAKISLVQAILMCVSLTILSDGFTIQVASAQVSPSEIKPTPYPKSKMSPSFPTKTFAFSGVTKSLSNLISSPR